MACLADEIGVNNFLELLLVVPIPIQFLISAVMSNFIANDVVMSEKSTTTASDTSRMDSLLERKEALEASIGALTGFLTKPGMPGLSGNLIDEEGFPRADVDLYQVRDARHKLVCFQNDHKALMKQIEEELFSLHEKIHVAVPRSSASGAVDGRGTTNSTPEITPSLGVVGPPFAVIDQVFPGGPAEKAGLKVNDKIRRVGNTIDVFKLGSVKTCFANIRNEICEGVGVKIVVERIVAQNSNSMSSAPAVAADSEKIIEIATAGGDKLVLETSGEERIPYKRIELGGGGSQPRQDGKEEIIVTLVPEKWTGPGLLGCHILPFAA